jgi:hypothetical protein
MMKIAKIRPFATEISLKSRRGGSGLLIDIKVSRHLT